MTTHIRFFITIIFLALASSWNAGLAKKAPSVGNLEADGIAQPGYVRPAEGYGRPLTDEFDSGGLSRRLYFPDFKSAYSEPKDVAEDFLRQRGAILGTTGEDLELLSSKQSLASRHFRYQQMWQGIPVFASHVVINVRLDGVISSVVSDYKIVSNIPTAPAIIADDAARTAVAAIGLQQIRDETTTELVVLANDDVQALCWLVTILASKPLGDWQVFVDAISGEVRSQENIICFVDGSGFTFDPNPIVSTRNLSLADSSDNNYPALTNARFDVRLRDLNPPQGGFYYLTGPYATTAPTSNRARVAHADSFHFNRQDNRFEEVVVYYQVDLCERFYQALGFDNIMHFPMSFNVNGTSDDNSWYSPGQVQITYGTGGVDDAEDGDVVIHEYGHATQYDQVPNWGQTHEGGAMGEGFGDYLTVSVFHPVSGGFDEAQVFDWDANPEDNFWPGRRVDRNKHYPEDMTGQVHADGEIWSRCLWDIQNDIGHDTTLQVLLEGHFALTPSAQFDDAANAMVEADMNIYGGRHVMQIGQAFVDRGIFQELPIQLDIEHQPLVDTENIMGPYDIRAHLVHSFPIDTLAVFYRVSPDTGFSAIPMTPTGNPDEFLGLIPGPGHQADIGYYVRVVDSLGFVATLPSGAPGNIFDFHAGPDTVLPSIFHNAIENMAYVSWPPTVMATITDNLGVDSAWVEYMINSEPQVSLTLNHIDSTDIWINDLTGNVAPGDSVHYRIKALDSSQGGNIAQLPQSGYYSFAILDLITVTYTRAGFDIPDFPNVPHVDTLRITELLEVYGADLYVDIRHPNISDLYMYIQNPFRARVTLHNRTGGDGDSIVGWYDDEIAPDGPGQMDDFVDMPATGAWIFYLSDRVSGNVGVINTWSLRLLVPGLVGVEDDNSVVPKGFALNQNYPNPFNPSTVISFNLPQAGDVSLEVYDLLGRTIRVLTDGQMSAGIHRVEWDGRTLSGDKASSGIYFARLVSGQNRDVIRMSLIK